MPRFRSFLLFICIFILPSGTMAQEDPNQPGSPRIATVRKMYQPLPPLILEVREPIQITKAVMYRDGGTIIVDFKDAGDKAHHFRLDRKINSPTRNTMYYSAGKAQEERSLALRGPEEAALYGLLLRLQAKGGAEEKWVNYVRSMVQALDMRFSAEANPGPGGAKRDGPPIRRD